MADIEKALEFQSQGKLDEAKAIYLEFLKEMPKQPDISNLVGLICLQKEELEEAKNFFETAVKGFPCAEFFQNLGLVFFKQKEYQDAMQNFDKAIEFENENLDFIRNFAQMAKQTEQIDFAIKFFKKTLEIEPKDSVGWNNLGLMYEKKQDFENAKKCYINSLKIEKNHPASHNLGVLYRTLRNFDESIKCLKQALKLKPNDNETMVSLGMSYLSKKDLENGYKYYQFLKPEIKAKYENPLEEKNHWDGRKHPDSTLLVFYYLGYGDHIMFTRYLPFLKDYFKKVKVWLPMSVKVLIEKNIDGIEFVDSGEVDYDFSANIMELQYLLNMDFEHIPFSSGYLKVHSEKISEYKKYFSSQQKSPINLKIGLFWQGNPKVFVNRSIKLKELELIMNIENADFYSFEKEDEHNQILEYPKLKDLGSTFKNFEDTAGALMNLDILITIDSAIAHLAGALGVKTYLLLPYSSEWRWFEDTETTPWYDSIKIFKQKEPYNWTPVVERVLKDLKKL